MWAIVETSLNPAYDLMKPFWELVLGPVPSQKLTPLAPPPATINENGPEDMDIDLTSPSTSSSSAPPPPPTSSESPSSPPPSSSSSKPDQIVVDEVAAEDSDEFEDEPTAAPVPASTPEEKAQEKEHDDFHKIIAEEMAAAAEDGKELAYGLWGRVNAVFLGKKTAEVSLLRRRAERERADILLPSLFFPDARLHPCSTFHRRATPPQDRLSSSGRSSLQDHPVRGDARRSGSYRREFQSSFLSSALFAS